MKYLLIICINIIFFVGCSNQVNLEDEDFYSIITPIWKTDKMYEETCSFLGKNDFSVLLYEPKQVLSVTDYFGNNISDQEYEINNRCIFLKNNSSINYWEYEELYPKNPDNINVFKTVDDKYILFDENIPNTHQIRITYKHDNIEECDFLNYQEEKNIIFKELMNNLEEINFLVFGDSISVGYGSSKFLNIPPFQLSYSEIVAEYLAKFYNKRVNFINLSKAGTNSKWAKTVDFSSEQVPNIAVIAFGMNEINNYIEEYESNIKMIIDNIRKINADSFIVLVSSMHPNLEVNYTHSNLVSFEEKLNEIAINDDKIICANVTSASDWLYKHKKRFIDFGSNNKNHPNDFMHRIYAQVILYTLFGESYWNEIH